MNYTLLATRRENGVEYLTLNRPDVRNAFNEIMIAELSAWTASVANDRRVRVVVLGGAGPTFSAGADVAWMQKQVGYSKEENVADATAAARMFADLDELPVPLIGRIQGAALGGGAGLAAVCDVVVTDDQAVFGFTEVKLGIIPAIISPFALAKIGRSAARELFLTGARFSAERARDIGLVHAVVPLAELDDTVARFTQAFLSAGPEAIAAAKTLIRDVWNKAPREAVSATAAAIAGRRISPEGQEGLKAFLEKRKPSWAP